MSHDRLERRSIAFHTAVAAKLRERPELLGIALDNLARWSKLGSRSQPYFDAWRAILEKPFEAMLAIIAEDTPEMRELRQSSPFAGVLEPKERWQIYDTFELGTHHPRGGDHR